MPNQLLQRLQNQLSNQKPINLISPENYSFEISENHDKSNENIFLFSSIALTALLAFLTYVNYIKSAEIKILNESIVDTTNLTEINNEELTSKIEKLKVIKNIKESRTPVQSFFFFLKEINKVDNSQFIDLKYQVLNKNIEFTLIINSSNQQIEKNFQEIIKRNNFKASIEKQSESTVEGTDLKQYSFKGKYEL